MLKTAFRSLERGGQGEDRHAMLNGDDLVLPYGLSDAAVGVAVISVPELLAELQRPESGSRA